MQVRVHDAIDLLRPQADRGQNLLGALRLQAVELSRLVVPLRPRPGVDQRPLIPVFDQQQVHRQADAVLLVRGPLP